MAYKNKSKSRKHFGRKEYNETIERRVQIKNKSCGKRQNSKEFLLTQSTWRREKKKKPKAENRENKLKLRKKKKKKKGGDFNVNVLVTCVLKSELSHLVRKVSCPSFICSSFIGGS